MKRRDGEEVNRVAVMRLDLHFLPEAMAYPQAPDISSRPRSDIPSQQSRAEKCGGNVAVHG